MKAVDVAVVAMVALVAVVVVAVVAEGGWAATAGATATTGIAA